MNGRTLTNASAADRNGTDFYATPREATIALAYVLNLAGKRVYEPAAGKGHMVHALQELGAILTFGDLYPDGFDFTKRTPYAGIDWIITNPPFSQSEAFIKSALAWNPRIGVALLLKSQYWHAARRYKLFHEHPPSAIMPLTWRPDFLFGSKGGAPTMEVAWSVWIRGYGGPTQYVPLPKPDEIPTTGKRGGPRLLYSDALLRAVHKDEDDARCPN